MVILFIFGYRIKVIIDNSYLNKNMDLLVVNLILNDNNFRNIFIFFIFIIEVI